MNCVWLGIGATALAGSRIWPLAVLLLKLERRGHIQLPPRRTASVNELRNRDFGQIDHDQSPIEGPLEKLQPVRIEPVIKSSAEARLFQFLLARYHYLGHRNCMGENLRVPSARPPG